jgi:hypothetical protein
MIFQSMSVQNRSVLSSVSILCTDHHQGFFQSEKYLQKGGNSCSDPQLIPHLA